MKEGPGKFLVSAASSARMLGTSITLIENLAVCHREEEGRGLEAAAAAVAGRKLVNPGGDYRITGSNDGNGGIDFVDRFYSCCPTCSLRSARPVRDDCERSFVECAGCRRNLRRRASLNPVPLSGQGGVGGGGASGGGEGGQQQQMQEKAESDLLMEPMPALSATVATEGPLDYGASSLRRGGAAVMSVVF